jgi:hypothetical protein
MTLPESSSSSETNPREVGDNVIAQEATASEDKEAVSGHTEKPQTSTTFRPEELKDKHKKSFEQKDRLVKLMEKGKSAREAIEFLNIDLKPSAAYKIFKRYKKNGPTALLDKRCENSPAPSVMTDEMKDILRALWFAYPAAGSKIIHDKAEEVCKTQSTPEKQIKVPSYESVKKFLALQSEQDRLLRAGKIEIFNQQGRSVVRFEMTTYSNERWQIDNKRLDVWTRSWIDDHWEPFEAHATIIIDAHSRAIAGCWVSQKHPDQWTTALAMRQAILPKSDDRWLVQGFPGILQPDRDGVFIGADVKVALRFLGTMNDPDPPRYPNRKGKVERWIETLDHGCLRGLLGHMDAVGSTREAAFKKVHLLPTLPELRKEIIKFIVEKYHCRRHSETRRKPIEHWQQDLKHFRVPESEHELNAMLLKTAKPLAVTNVGITFKSFEDKDMGGDYWAPGISDYWGDYLAPRFNPEDDFSIALYNPDTGKFVMDAFLMGRPNAKYDIADVKEDRNQIARGQRERLSMYAKRAEEIDRPTAEAAARKHAAKLLEKRAAKKAEIARKRAAKKSTKNAGNLVDARALLDRIERRARGED